MNGIQHPTLISTDRAGATITTPFRADHIVRQLTFISAMGAPEVW